MDETHQVPNYLKIVCHFVMSTYEDYERDATKMGNIFAASYFKEMVRAHIILLFIFQSFFSSLN